MRETWIMSERKERTRQALTERYYGKKDILASWENPPTFSCIASKRFAPVPDMDYIYNLRRRVRGYQNDLAYRGVDEFSESSNGSANL